MNTPQYLRDAQASFLRRRWFLKDCGVGLAGIAASSLLQSEAHAQGAKADDTSAATVNPLVPQDPHFDAKAKHVIYMFNAGAPSQLELFDPKPELQARDGQLPPADLLKGYRAAFIDPNSALLGGKFKFEKQGQCGMELSEVLPHTAEIADDICLIRSMQTEAVNHAPAQIMMNTGSQQFGRPSFGAWTLYGQRVGRPAWLRRADQCKRNQWWRQQLRCRLSTDDVRRSPVSQLRRSGALSV